MKKTVLGMIAASALMAAAPQAMAAEIAVIVKSVNSNFWQNVRTGAEDAIKKQSGYTMTFQGPAAESSVAEQVNMVENAVNRKVAGIVLAPSDPDALIPVMKRAWESRIPVVLIDSMVSESGAKYYQSFLATDNAAAGAMAAKHLVDTMGKTGKVAIMSYVAGVGSEIGRVGGFKKYLAENSKVEVVGTYYSQSQMATALNQTTDILAANPDLTGIFGANEPTAIGMGRAIAQAGKSGKVAAVGFDGNADLQGFVKDGTLGGIIVQSSYQMGNAGIETVAKVIKGEKVQKTIDTGAVLVTKGNIDSAEAKNVLY